MPSALSKTSEVVREAYGNNFTPTSRDAKRALTERSSFNNSFALTNRN